MINFLNLMPREPGGVFDWLLKIRLRLKARNDIKPVTVAPVVGDATLGALKNRLAQAIEFHISWRSR